MIDQVVTEVNQLNLRVKQAYECEEGPLCIGRGLQTHTMRSRTGATRCCCGRDTKVGGKGSSVVVEDRGASAGTV